MEQKDNNNYVSMKTFGLFVGGIITVSIAVWGILFGIINSTAQQVRENQMSIGKMEAKMDFMVEGVSEIKQLIKEHMSQ